MNAQQAGKLMQGHRRRRKLTQDDVVNAGAVSSAQYLSQLENGKYDVRNSEFFRPLAALYRLTPDQVREIVPDAVLEFNGGQLSAVPSAPTSAPIIPAELVKAAEMFGDDVPTLRDPRWQHFMVSFNFRDGGKKKPIEWLKMHTELIEMGILPDGME